MSVDSMGRIRYWARLMNLFNDLTTNFAKEGEMQRPLFMIFSSKEMDEAVITDKNVWYEPHWKGSEHVRVVRVETTTISFVCSWDCLADFWDFRLVLAAPEFWKARGLDSDTVLVLLGQSSFFEHPLEYLVFENVYQVLPTMFRSVLAW